MSKKENETTESNDKQPGGITGKGFVKGKSGNPKGRKKETKAEKKIKKAVKTAVEKHMVKLERMLTDVGPALRKRIKGGDVQAIRELHDRVMGKPKQNVDLGFEKSGLEELTELLKACAITPENEKE